MKRSVWIIGIAMIILILLIAIYFSDNKPNNNQGLEPVNTQINNTIESKNGFLTYSNKEYGFYFEYPEFDENNVKIELHEFEPDEDGLIILLAPNYGDDVSSDIFSVYYKPITIEKEIENIRKSYDNTDDWQLSLEISDINLAGTSGKKLEGKVISKNEPGYIGFRFFRYLLVHPENKEITII